MIRRILGDKLLKLRKNRKWTQSEAAEHCDISNRYYQVLERGEKWPTDVVLGKIFKAFQVDPHDFFGSSSAEENILSKIEELSMSVRLLFDERFRRITESDFRNPSNNGSRR